MDVIDVYLSDGEVAVVDASGALWRRESESTIVAIEALAGYLRVASGGHVRVWLGAALCRPVRIAPVVGDLSRRERVRLIEMAAIAQSGLTPPCRVSIDVVDAVEEAVTVVVEEAVLREIDRRLAAAGRRVGSIQPWWAHALATALREQPTLRALGVTEGEATTILVGEGRRFTSAHAMCPIDGVEAASAAFARALISAMVSEDDALSIRLDWTAVDAPGARAFTDHEFVFGPWALRQGESS